MAARLAAPTADGRVATEAHYNGKIDSPRLVNRALSTAEMMSSCRGSSRTICGPSHRRLGLLAPDPLAADHRRVRQWLGRRGRQPADAGGDRVQLDRHRDALDAAPQEYGAIHFHDDDIYDAELGSRLRVDGAAGPAQRIYAIRLSDRHSGRLPPVLRPAGAGKPSAKLLYIAQTATYMAYANHSFTFTSSAAELLANRLIIVQPWEQHLNAHLELGASLYDVHPMAAESRYSSRLRPISTCARRSRPRRRGLDRCCGATTPTPISPTGSRRWVTISTW